MPKGYTKETLQAAMSVRKSAIGHGVPRKTLEDHVKGRVSMKPPGPALQLNEEEEVALVNYIKYMSRQGFPMTRDIIRKFIGAIFKKRWKEDAVQFRVWSKW